MDDRNQSHVNDYAARLIRFKARQLSHRRAFAGDDRRDLEQDLWLDLLERLPRYDARKASLETFIARVVEHKVASLLRFKTAEKRAFDREEASLNEPVLDADGSTVERHEVTPEAARDPWAAWERERDVESVLAGLSDLNRAVAISRAFGTPNFVSSDVGISRRAVAKHIAELREIFEDAGLRDYL